ncbi:MAG: 4-(cytidine 5'-diphospho)-2-C-methyl-D-erythritol kinase [Acidobacteriota bacterium]
MISTSFSLPSFAKINRSLQILGKRPDGYHELRTILQTISLHDDLHFELSGGAAVTLSCSSPDVPADESNLVVRAAYALKDRFGVDKGAHVRLKKRIPAKAGLGGGSSNAAVSLLALARLWKVEVTTPALLEIAGKLGADVPFFLLGGTALGQGTGTTLSPLPDNALRHLIVVTPNANVSTADAYTAVNSAALTTLKADPILSSSPVGADFQDSPPGPLRNDLSNDFESVIFDIEPEIKRAKEALLQAGACNALLAGSGSSVFGVFSNQEAQRLALNEIKLEEGWRIFACVTLSRNEYSRALSVGEVSLVRSFNSDSDIGA